MNFNREELEWVAAHVPGWKRAVKRALDLLASATALLLLSPLLLAIALLVKTSSKGPVFFLQERVGYLGKSFRVCKFRTMVQNAMDLGGFETSPQDPRITPVGRFLRRWSLDELPQFWNILLGEMSLVGPRPTLAYQVAAYDSRQRRRLLVRPGMSGLAQVSGRNLLSWPERIELDIRYIESFSLWQDAVILAKTIGLVLSNQGVYGADL